MWWLLISLLPTLALVILNCGNDRATPQRPKPSDKSSKSAKTASKKTTSSRPASKSSKSRKSSRSSKTASKSGKQTSKSGKTTSKSEKTSKSWKSAKSSKSGKSQKSTKSAKSFSKSRLVKPVAIKEEQAVTKKTEEQKPPQPVVAARKEEPGKAIFAEPASVYFRSIGGLDKFSLVNDTNERRAFKVKCSDNQLYRFCPVSGFIPPHGTAIVEVIRQNGTVKADKAVVVLTSVAPGTVAGAKEIMSAAPQNECQMMVVPLVVDA